MFGIAARKYINATRKGNTVCALHYHPCNLLPSQFPGFGKFEGDSGFEFTYLFDVMSYVSKWRVDGESNSVTFANKLIESTYLNTSAKKIPPFRTFAPTQPGPPISEYPSILAHMLSDNLNVNMQMINGRLFAISDMAGHMEIDPLTLKTVGMLEFKDKLTSKLSVITCAHPSQLTNEPFAYNYYGER